MPKKPPLTKAKRKWAANRDVTLKGTRLAYSVPMQIRYQLALQKLVTKMSETVNKQVTRLFNGELADDYFEQQEQAAAMDASIASKAKKLMNSLSARFQQLFNERSKSIAETMVNGADDTSKSSLHSSLKELSGGLSLPTGVVPSGMNDIYTATVNENVKLIRSIPQQYFTNVTGDVMRSITTGNGLADLVPQLHKQYGITMRRATLLALDQTRKAYNSINKERMQAVGVKQFKWNHSGGGQHPRKSHIALSGNIFSFDDLPIINQEQVQKGYESPQRGIPGQAINCRCTMTPVINFDND